MNPAKTEIIFGPPGTGKTHKLLSIAQTYLETGYGPEDLCVVTFTKKGAAEAKQRAMEKFQLPEARFIWWRTLHSLAFYQLGLGRKQIMGFSDYLQICGQLGISITSKGVSDDGTVSGLSKGDRLFFTENMARALMITLREYWEREHNEDLYWYELELLQKTLLAYKAANGKSDYTDLIYAFNKSPSPPNIKVLIVDEAQDLTPLQWQMVEHLAKNAEKIYIAGDDDQAIFRWAGATPDYFIGLKGTRNILPQSFRVPIKVQGVAESIVHNIKTRVAKTWQPTEVPGSVLYEPTVEGIDMSQGTWLLLARNTYLLQEYNNYCLQMGYVFDSRLGSPIRGESLQAIVAWEQLRSGKSVTALQVKYIYELMSTKERIASGYKKRLKIVPDNTILTFQQLLDNYGLLHRGIWHEALDGIEEIEREYFIAALRRGEKLLREPRIRINTIHGVKGGEADNVVIQLDMAAKTWQEYQDMPDDEHRVWYVAVTRAKRNLYILEPKTERSYNI